MKKGYKSKMTRKNNKHGFGYSQSKKHQISICSKLVKPFIVTRSMIEHSSLSHKSFLLGDLFTGKKGSGVVFWQVSTTDKRQSVTEKKFFVAFSGGKVVDGDLYFTPVGELTSWVAMHYTSQKAVFLELNLNQDRSLLHQKILQGLNSIDDGGLLVFVGDIAGGLDGEIIPLLNIKSGELADCSPVEQFLE